MASFSGLMLGSGARQLRATDLSADLDEAYRLLQSVLHGVERRGGEENEKLGHVLRDACVRIAEVRASLEGTDELDVARVRHLLRQVAREIGRLTALARDAESPGSPELSRDRG